LRYTNLIIIIIIIIMTSVSLHKTDVQSVTDDVCWCVII